MEKPKISLVIPAYNEVRRVQASMKQVLQFASDYGRECEVLLVVEKSSDRTADLAKKVVQGHAAIQIIENSVHKGKGYAVKTGMLRASGDFVFFMDLDLSTPLKEVERFLVEATRQPSVDVWIGNRRHAETEITRRQSLLRQTMGRIFNWFVRRFAIRGIIDTQCGFKLFRKHTVRPVFEKQTFNGFSFDVEVLLIAETLGYKIQDLPVEWKNSPETKVRIVRDSLKMIFDLIRVRGRVNETFSRLAERTAEQVEPKALKTAQKKSG